MRFLHISALLLALAWTTVTAVSSSALSIDGVQNGTVVVESLSSPPLGWVKDDTHHVDKEVAPVRLRLHLSHQNMDKFHEIALNIATPGNHQYGAHMPQKAIDDIFAPKAEAGNMIMDWLESAGLVESATYSARGDSIILLTSIAHVERLLNAEYSAYRNTETNEVVLRTLEFSLPDSLLSHVDMVQPTTFFGFRAFRSNVSGAHRLKEATSSSHIESRAVVGGCSFNIQPTCLANLYDIKSAKNYTNGLLGIAGFLEQYAAPSDLETFMSKYGGVREISNNSQSFTCVSVNNGSCPTSSAQAGFEANLDVQYARGITRSVPITYYSTGGRGEWTGDPDEDNTNEPFLEFLEYLLGEADPLPNTLSISYGDDQSTVPDAYAKHVCDLFSQLGARGVSVLVSSGNSGLGEPRDCISKDGDKQLANSFPASCPWVTTVGGTTGTGPQVAWPFSGGGFSRLFRRPSYQDAAVKAWLGSGVADPMRPYFNATGRAYPDVAAQADGYVIVVNGSTSIAAGTSASVTTFASIVQLVNSDRVSRGKTGLGFLNPWLYANANSSALTDIKTGNTTGCDGEISDARFEAVSGWDPTTGLGTPVFTSLLALSNKT